jgi:nitrogen regulatory protein PII-like uncharacterized protein
MSDEKRERVLMLDGEKPEELMTPEELDAYYVKSYGMTFDEFNETYKDDTPELIISELRDFIRARVII